MFVVDVLVCTSAATAKIRTLRRYAMGGAFLNFYQVRLGELFFLTQDLGGNQFALNRVRDENGFPLLAPNPFPTKSDIFNFQIYNAHMISKFKSLKSKIARLDQFVI